MNGPAEVRLSPEEVIEALVELRGLVHVVQQFLEAESPDEDGSMSRQLVRAALVKIDQLTFELAALEPEKPSPAPRG